MVAFPSNEVPAVDTCSRGSLYSETSRMHGSFCSNLQCKGQNQHPMERQVRHRPLYQSCCYCVKVFGVCMNQHNRSLHLGRLWVRPELFAVVLEFPVSPADRHRFALLDKALFLMYQDPLLAQLSSIDLE